MFEGLFGVKLAQAGNWAGLWQAFLPALLGLACLFAGAVLARLLRRDWLGLLGAGAGVVAGWLLLAGSLDAALQAGPRDLGGRLVLLGLAALVLALLTHWVAPRRGYWPCLVLLAAAAGWWLAGAPRTAADLARVGFLLAGLVAWHLFAPRAFAASAGRLALAGVSLVLALWLVRVPPVWLLIALVPGLIGPGLGVLRGGEYARVLTGFNLAAAIAAGMLAVGRLPALGLGAADLAFAAPVIAVVLAPRLRLAPALAMPLAGLIAVGLAWGGWYFLK
jgi:hypothetical protein